MKKHLLLTLAAMTAGAGLMAAPLTPEAALARIGGDLPQKAVALTGNNLKLKFTELRSEQAAIYMFTPRNGVGYLVVSADDTTTPLLGFSDTGVLPATRDELPDGMRWWLETLAEQVEWNAAHPGMPVRIIPKSERAGISPLCTTRWNQSDPYYNLTPTENGKHCVTGCVATAMAQVLKYYEYPETGVGTHSYEWTKSDKTTLTLSFDYAATTFDWGNMNDIYETGNYTDAQATAVATLMSACGISVDMEYGTGSSGAVSSNMGPALINNFGYDKGLRYLSRDYYTLTEWEDIVYNNLVDYGPVLYGGRNSSSGHQFVCDGYLNDYFHFNWGWGGLSDGYFLLTALDPDSQGIGGSTSGYNLNQAILTNLTYGGKTTSYWEMLTWDSDLEFTQTEVDLGTRITIYGKVANGCITTLPALKVGVQLIPANGGDPIFIVGRTTGELEPGYYYKDLDLYLTLPDSLAEGTYTVVPAFEDSEGNVTRMLVPVTNAGSATMRVEDGKAIFANAEPASLTVSGFTLDSYLTTSNPFQISATLKNRSETQEYLGELTVGIVKDGTLSAWGNRSMVDIPAGESLNWEYISALTTKLNSFTIAAGDYQMGIYAYDSSARTYTLISNLIDVTMKNASTPTLEVTDFKIEDGQNPYSIKGTATLKCTSGYFAGSLTCYIFPASGGNSLASFSSNFVTVAASNYGAAAKAPASGSVPVEFNMCFSNASENASYMAGVYYGNTLLTTNPRYVTFTTGDFTTGVEDIGNNSSEVVSREYITLTGAVLKTDTPAAGVYIVRERHTDGSVTTRRELIH